MIQMASDLANLRSSYTVSFCQFKKLVLNFNVDFLNLFKLKDHETKLMRHGASIVALEAEPSSTQSPTFSEFEVCI